jgi:hypothetical protein
VKRALAALALTFAASACGAAPKPLPKDLLPPEYEPPRGYDMGGAPKEAPPPPPPAPKPAEPPPAPKP